MAKQKTIEVPWDVFEQLMDTVREHVRPFSALDHEHPNLMLWVDPIGLKTIVITPQREDQPDEDQGRTGTAGAATRIEDAAIESKWEHPLRRALGIQLTPYPA